MGEKLAYLIRIAPPQQIYLREIVKVRNINIGLEKELLDLIADPCWPQKKRQRAQVFRLERQHRLAIKPILRAVIF
ncbi:MAG: hypothetical protein ACK44M_10520 [Chloroflexus sp.]